MERQLMNDKSIYQTTIVAIQRVSLAPPPLDADKCWILQCICRGLQSAGH